MGGARTAWIGGALLLILGFMVLTAGEGEVAPPPSAVSPTADHPMLDRHRRMVDQMRLDTSPQMTARMLAGPMWQMRLDPRWIDQEEAHQAQVDRMLGRRPGP